jgi:hypothetical protein
MKKLHEEQKKKKYRLLFVQEECLQVEIYANDEEQAEQIASDLDYSEFRSKSCDFNMIAIEEIEE